MQGIPVEIKFGTKTDTLFIHPDGMIVGNSTQLQLQFERTRRAAKNVDRIRKKLLGGQLSRDEWEEAQRKLDEQMAEGMTKLDERLTSGEINQKEFDETKRTNDLIYRQQVDSLLNQRDGEMISLDEEDKLSLELEEWLKRATVKPFAVPMLKSCVLDWTLEATGEDGRTNGEKLAVSFESLQSLPEDFLIVAFTKVFNRYSEDAEQEKKPTENLQLPSVTKKANSDESLNGFRSLELPEATDLTRTGLQSGDNESSTVPLQN
jgi:hypothetical protein